MQFTHRYFAKLRKKSTKIYADVTQFDIESIKTPMSLVCTAQQNELKQFNIGQPSTSFLSNLRLKINEKNIPITAIAQFVLKDQKNVTVQVLDKQYMKDVERCINSADTGSICQTDSSTSFNVPVPRVTKELREKILRQIALQTEKYKNQLRKIRATHINTAMKSYPRTEFELIQKEIEGSFSMYMLNLERSRKLKEAEINK